MNEMPTGNVQHKTFPKPNTLTLNPIYSLRLKEVMGYLFSTNK